MEGYSVDEAAAILDCAPGTVKSRCSRGRAKLVPLLTSYRRNQPSPIGVESLSAPRATPTESIPDHPTTEDVSHD